MAVEEQKEEPRKIDLAKLNAWIRENTTNGKCPFCDTNSWSVPNAPGVLGVALPWGDGKGDMYMTGLPVLPITCKKCFFVRQISLTEENLEKILEDSVDASAG